MTSFVELLDGSQIRLAPVEAERVRDAFDFDDSDWVEAIRANDGTVHSVRVGDIAKVVVSW